MNEISDILKTYQFRIRNGTIENLAELRIQLIKCSDLLDETINEIDGNMIRQFQEQQLARKDRLGRPVGSSPVVQDLPRRTK